MREAARLLARPSISVRAASAVIAASAFLLLATGPGEAAASTPDPGQAGASIVAGETGSIESFPWLAYVAYRGPVDRFSCGGTVVAPRLVLTAAHCALTSTGKRATASNFSVLTGVTDLRQATPDRRSAVSQVLIFPGYDPARVLHDAALLVLASPVAAPSLPIATPADAGLLAGGTPVAVAGWGLTRVSPPRLPAVLRQAQSVVGDASSCRRALGNALLPFQPAGQICVRSGASLCNGDSGGPAVATRADGTAVVIGIASLKASPTCSPRVPQVLARVDQVSSWASAWIAAIESGGPAPPIAVPELKLPPVTRGDAELVAALGLEADFGIRFVGGRGHEIACRRLTREKVKCRLQWLYRNQLFRGAITVYTALPREGSIYNYRYTIRRFRLGCWLRNLNPIPACNPRVFKR